MANPDPANEKIITTATMSHRLRKLRAQCGRQTASGWRSCPTAQRGEQDSGQDQVFIWSKKTGQSKQLTHVTGGIESLAWSPDGKSIAFLFVENATRSAGALAAMKPWAGVIGEDGVEIQRVAVVDAGQRIIHAGHPRQPARL